MKKIIAILAISVLSGCAMIDAYLMKYDPNEYQQITDIRTTALLAKADCDNFSLSKQNADIIARKTVSMKNLSEFIPHNSKVIAASIELDKMAQGLKDMYAKSDKVSTTFCKIKFQTIEKSAETMQQTIGAKPR